MSSKQDLIIDILKENSEKLDKLMVITASQEERIKQNTKDIDSQKKKIWGAVGAALGSFLAVITSKFI